MTDYNKYVMAVNKIFEVIAKLKVDWNSQENLTYISNIEEYKQVVINSFKEFSNKEEQVTKLAKDVEEKL